MARDINSVILVGRLTRDPELSYTQNQTAICRFSIANNRIGANQQEEVNFFDIVTWDKIATSCSQYLKKGRQVVVEGRLQQNRFQDKQTGANRSKVEVVAQSVQFTGGRQDNQQSGSSPQGQGNPPPTQAPGGLDDGGFNDDEVPF